MSVCVFLIGCEDLSSLTSEIIEILMWDLHAKSPRVKRGPFAWRKGGGDDLLNDIQTLSVSSYEEEDQTEAAS